MGAIINSFLSSLANGALRQEIEKEGGLKLIYNDPPFAVGNDFGYTIIVQANLPKRNKA